jgi:hypothetical protein
VNAPEGTALQPLGRLHRHVQLEMLVGWEAASDPRLNRPEVNARFGFELHMAWERLDAGVLNSEQSVANFTGKFDRHRVPLALRRAQVRAPRTLECFQPPQYRVARFAFMESQPGRQITDPPPVVADPGCSARISCEALRAAAARAP